MHLFTPRAWGERACIVDNIRGYNMRHIVAHRMHGSLCTPAAAPNAQARESTHTRTA